MAFHQYRTILRKLVDYGGDFIVVGGVAAVVAGAPVNTFDIDIVHSREPDNITRALKALGDLDACCRLHPPNESHLASPGHHLLMTEFGALDVLGTIGKGLTYSDLLPHSDVREIAPGLRVRVLYRETLIAVKEEVGRDQDLAVLPVLRATLAEIRRRQSESSTTSECG
jgi:hypothetical protein